MSERSLRNERRNRADLLLVERQLAPSRAKAQALIMAGVVSANGRRIDKAGIQLGESAQITVKDTAQEYVSRGGHKLAGALRDFAAFGLDVTAKVAADFGASTGGFVDCLLRNGAVKVYAIDVGTGLLHERLRADTRVIVKDRTNARQICVEQLGERVDLVVIDVSFIGLEKILHAAHGVLKLGGELVALIKPQFEVGKKQACRTRGVIRDTALRAQVIEKTLQIVEQKGFDVVADAPCVLAGPKGNREHFVYATARA